MGQPRNKTYNPKVVGIYHCWSQCAQQEFLLGLQSELGGSRKNVVELRTRFLAAIFAIEVFAPAQFAPLRAQFEESTSSPVRRG